MHTIRLLSAITCRPRTLLSLILAFTLLPWAFGPVIPVHADDPDVRDHRGEGQPAFPPGTPVGPGTVRDHRFPAARLQVVVKKVHVFDDSDWHGAGDLSVSVNLYLCSSSCANGDDGPPSRISHQSTIMFNADSGDTVTLNEEFPSHYYSDHSNITGETGYPALAGERYLLQFHLWDREAQDIFGPAVDSLGYVEKELDAGGGWGVGVHTGRGKIYGPSGGDMYELEYEIRKMPLPDLRANTIRLVESGDQQFYCVLVENVGEQPSESFQVVVRADDAPMRTVVLPALEVHRTAEHCVLRSELPAGEHMLSFTVDEGRMIAEMDERNNQYKWRIQPRAAVGGSQFAMNPGQTPTLMPTPSTALSDLTVSAIRVNGQAPDGKDDCQNGKNAVTVVVKNVGKGDAEGFVLRLAVDADQAIDKAVPGLGAGAEREVRFDDVRLTKGVHKLQASADAKGAVAASDEDNNTLTVAAQCRDAN